MTIQCPKCGRFCKNVMAEINGFDQIIRVDGDCKIHGKVDLTEAEWSYDDFSPPESET